MKGKERLPRFATLSKHCRRVSDAFILRCDGAGKRNGQGQKHWQVTGAWQETQSLKTNTQETPGKEGLGTERARHTQEQSQRSVSRVEAFQQIQ